MKVVQKLLSVCVLVLAMNITASAEVKIEDEQAVMPADQLPATAQRIFWSARLSPDGKHLLYAQKSGSIALRELATGKDIELPVGKPQRGMASAFTRFQFFSPDSTKLALFRPREMKENAAPGGDASHELVLFEIATNKVTPIPTPEGMPIAHFPNNGAQLIVSTMGRGGPGQKVDTQRIDLATMKSTPLHPPGWVQSVSPNRSIATIYSRVLPNPADPADPVRGAKPDRRINFLLWDLEKDQQLAELPTHPRNSQLDDVQAIWSNDGRYVAYVDRPEVENTREQLTRIWDAQDQKLVSTLAGRLALGPGPGKSDFLISSVGEGDPKIDLHNAADVSTTTLSESGKQLAHAHGERILYLAQKDAQLTLFVGKLVKK